MNVGSSTQTRCLVTGGAGFLGINMVRYLLARGYEVASLDVAPFDYPERTMLMPRKPAPPVTRQRVCVVDPLFMSSSSSGVVVNRAFEHRQSIAPAPVHNRSLIDGLWLRIFSVMPMLLFDLDPHILW